MNVIIYQFDELAKACVGLGSDLPLLAIPVNTDTLNTFFSSVFVSFYLFFFSYYLQGFMHTSSLAIHDKEQSFGQKALVYNIW